MNISLNKDSIIAGLVTSVCVVAILLWLLLSSLHYDSKLASADNPQLEEEELFLDPELMLEQNKEIGEPEAVNHDSPAPEIKGEPVPAPVEQTHTVHSGESQTPTMEQQLVTSSQESAVQNAASDRKRMKKRWHLPCRGNSSPTRVC